MVTLVPLKTISDSRGRLTVAEKLPFQIRRSYWLHGVDVAAMRGGHAHRALHRLMVAVSGGFTVNADGEEVRLDYPGIGLLIPPMHWLELLDFTPGAVCMVLASEEHDEADCIRDRAEFERLR